MSSQDQDTRSRESGRIWFEAGTERICYESQHYGTWDVALRDVRVIGEYTTDHGPFEDDYFFVFVLDRQGWFEASFYATGRDEFFDQLTAAIGLQVSGELVTSTDYKSNVLWPPEIAGAELFTPNVGEWKLSEAVLRMLP